MFDWSLLMASAGAMAVMYAAGDTGSDVIDAMVCCVISVIMWCYVSVERCWQFFG